LRRYAPSSFYPLKVASSPPVNLHSSFSITEARVIHAIATRGEAEVADLVARLGSTPAISADLNRSGRGVMRAALPRRSPSPAGQADRPKGRRTFASLDRRSSAEIGGVAPCALGEQQRRLVEAMGVNPEDPWRAARAPPARRSARSSRRPWLGAGAARAPYDETISAGTEFEALVARISRVPHPDPDASASVAGAELERRASRRRLLRPQERSRSHSSAAFSSRTGSRQRGSGGKLVDRCIDLPSQGLRRMVLWTNSSLASARRIYDDRGSSRLARNRTPYSRGHGRPGASPRSKPGFDGATRAGARRAVPRTDGEEGHDWQGTHTLLLTTTGKRSGEPRTTALIYGRRGDDYLRGCLKGRLRHPPTGTEHRASIPRCELQVKEAASRRAAGTRRPRRSRSCGRR